MTVHIFEHGRRRAFVAGLFWQPLVGSAKDRRKAAEKIASEQGFDLAVWRIAESGLVQVGMGSSTEGIKAGLYSAAAIVSKTVELETGSGEFLAATEISSGKWLYVAQREGIIAPDGDFAATEDGVRSRLLQDLSLSDWAHVFAPEHWHIANGIERSFESFLPPGGRTEYRRWWALEPVHRNPIRQYAPYAIILAAALGALHEYSAWQQARRARAVAEAQRLAEQAKAGAQAQVATPHPWKSEPDARRSAASCMRAMGKLSPLWVPGWVPKSMACTDGSLNVTWEREPTGWIAGLREMHPQATVSPDGTRASLSIVYPLSAGSDETAPQEVERRMALLDTAQRYGLRLEISTPSAPVSLPGTKPARQPAANPWNTLTWRIERTAFSPALVLSLLDGPAFRVSRIEARFNDGEIHWNLEGNQYVQAP